MGIINGLIPFLMSVIPVVAQEAVHKGGIPFDDFYVGGRHQEANWMGSIANGTENSFEAKDVCNFFDRCLELHRCVVQHSAVVDAGLGVDEGRLAIPRDP